MSELLELLDRGPMIALAIAMVLMIVVVVVIILQTRRIARLEAMLAQRGEAATDAPLRRIAELQARHEAAVGTTSAVALRPLLVTGAIVLVVVLALGGGWLLLGGGGDGGAAATTDQQAGTPTETTAATTTASEGGTSTPADPLEATAVPDEVPPLADTSAYTVLVFNASGVAGAAGDGVAPRLQTEGFNLLQPANYPTSENLDLSVVMYNGPENQEAAWSVADVLGIKRAPPLEGLTVDQVQGADVIVVVGLDLAESLVSTAAP